MNRSTQEEQKAGGLFSKGQRVPLKGVTIEVQARGVAARVTVTQRYQNVESLPIEAVYSFPLEESSAVCGFEVEIEDRRIIGKVQEKEEAFEIYDDAMAEGQGAFLLDQDRPNIFTASVGNLLPNQEVAIRIIYVTELELAGDQIRLMIPTTISPRYTPHKQLTTMDPSELDHINPPTALFGVTYGLRLLVELEAQTDIREVSCPSHPARVSMRGRKVTVELAGQDIQLDRDFVLNVTLDKHHDTTATVACDSDGTRVIMMNFFPDLSHLERSPCEYIFLLDRSGSMQGESIDQACRALQLCLRSLDEEDYFNVVSFGSRQEWLFDRRKSSSLKFSQETLDMATTQIQKFQANFGGTELYSPLNDILSMPLKIKGMKRQIVLLTDGQVSNEKQIIEMISLNKDNCRIFSFGIGYGASEHLVRGVARASKGKAEFIHPNERIEPKVLRQFGRMTSPNLTDVTLDWGSTKVDLMVPNEIPPIFDGDRLTIYARIKSGHPGEACLNAKNSQESLRFPVFIDTEKPIKDQIIPTLMARKVIQDIEEGREPRVRRGSSQQNRRQKQTENLLVELACTYQLMSSETSFVAIEERRDGVQQQNAELRRVPIALTKGWHGTNRKHPASSRPMVSSAMTGMMPPAPQAMGGSGLRRKAKGTPMRASSSAKRTGPPAMSPPPRPPAAPRAPGAPPSALSSRLVPAQQGSHGYGSKISSETRKCAEMSDSPFENKSYDDLMKLTMEQQAKGMFNFTKELAEVAQISMSILENAAQKLSEEQQIEIESAKAVVATLVALETFEKRFSDKKDQWRLIANKSERWLKKNYDISSLKNWIEKIL